MGLFKTPTVKHSIEQPYTFLVGKIRVFNSLLPFSKQTDSNDTALETIARKHFYKLLESANNENALFCFLSRELYRTRKITTPDNINYYSKLLELLQDNPVPFDLSTSQNKLIAAIQFASDYTSTLSSRVIEGIEKIPLPQLSISSPDENTFNNDDTSAISEIELLNYFQNSILTCEDNNYTKILAVLEEVINNKTLSDQCVHLLCQMKSSLKTTYLECASIQQLRNLQANVIIKNIEAADSSAKLYELLEKNVYSYFVSHPAVSMVYDEIYGHFLIEKEAAKDEVRLAL
ncbi:MAG: hypothetical protein Q8L78_05160 [Coxiellaceae bacterium]|nr:hypothetical protein [Coxiellaceae bacterium]